MKKTIAVLFPALGLSVGLSMAGTQDEGSTCHEDENKVTGNDGGYRCVAKKKLVTWNAKECVKDLKANDRTTLVVPLDYWGNPDFSKARLENFEFKFTCPLPTKGEE